MKKPRRMKIRMGQVEIASLSTEEFSLRLRGTTTQGNPVEVIIQDICPYGLRRIAKLAWEVFRAQESLFRNRQAFQLRALREED